MGSYQHCSIKVEWDYRRWRTNQNAAFLRLNSESTQKNSKFQVKSSQSIYFAVKINKSFRHIKIINHIAGSCKMTLRSPSQSSYPNYLFLAIVCAVKRIFHWEIEILFDSFDCFLYEYFS